MRKVWVTFSGEYEQRSAGPAFTTEELARQHSDDVEELFVWDRPLQKRTMFRVSGVFPSEKARDIESAKFVGGLKYDREGEWAITRDSYSCDEDHIGHCSSERVAWWSGKVGPIYVEVSGENQQEVIARFTALQEEVNNGRKPQ
jgi:hypothetical protein